MKIEAGKEEVIKYSYVCDICGKGTKCNIKGDRMKIEAGKEEVIKYSYICDICGKGTEHHRVCSICGRDLCSSCTKFDPRDMGDFPDKYCGQCFEIGQKYIDRINVQQEKFDAFIEEIEQEWRDEAIKAVKISKEKRGQI